MTDVSSDDEISHDTIINAQNLSRTLPFNNVNNIMLGLNSIQTYLYAAANFNHFFQPELLSELSSEELIQTLLNIQA
jgi:hypothetical protein